MSIDKVNERMALALHSNSLSRSVEDAKSITFSLSCIYGGFRDERLVEAYDLISHAIKVLQNIDPNEWKSEE